MGEPQQNEQDFMAPDECWRFKRAVCIWLKIPTPAWSAAMCRSLRRRATFVPR